MKKLMKVTLLGITLLTVPSVTYAATYLSAFSLSLPGLNQSVSTGLGQSKATSGATDKSLLQYRSRNLMPDKQMNKEIVVIGENK